MPTPLRHLTELLTAVNPALRYLPETFQKYRQLLGGRHHICMQTIPTITGFWAWQALCYTCGLTRTGTESTQDEAITAAHRLVGERDHPTYNDRPYCTDHDFTALLTEAGHPPVDNWKHLGHAQLPKDIAGDGYTVATDGSAIDNATGWAYMTNAGWCASGTVTTDHHSRTQVGELAAIDHALRLYPRGSNITLLVDNVGVGILVEDIIDLATRGKRLRGLPGWAAHDTAASIKGAAHCNDIRVLWTRSSTNRLHNLADTLARAATGTRAKKNGRPVDVEQIGHHCGSACTVIHNGEGLKAA